jgi:AhpD family alkylhydroperoxidase
VFIEHTLESAPPASRRVMRATAQHLGYLPSATRRLAASPEVLVGFQKLTGLFDSTTLDPVAREVVVMTIAVRNGCDVCVAMHTGRLRALGEGSQHSGTDPVAALMAQRPLADERLEAVRQFVLAVLSTAGGVDDATLDTFLSHGYTRRNALEVVLGIGTYTLSTFANRLTRAPVDPPLAGTAAGGAGAVASAGAEVTEAG